MSRLYHDLDEWNYVTPYLKPQSKAFFFLFVTYLVYLKIIFKNKFFFFKTKIRVVLKTFFPIFFLRFCKNYLKNVLVPFFVLLKNNFNYDILFSIIPFT